VGELSVTFSERERGTVVDSVTTQFVRVRPPSLIAIENHYTNNYLRPNSSDSVTMTVGLFDSQGMPAPDGTPIKLETTLGTDTPDQGTTVRGKLDFVLTSGDSEGDAVVKATAGPNFDTGIFTTTVVHIQNALPSPDAMQFSVTPADIRSKDTAGLTVTILDQWGDPVAGQQVRIGAEDDGQSGVITPVTQNASNATSSDAVQASEVITLTTNDDGEATALFTKAKDAAGVNGLVGVRAELLFDQGKGLEVVAEQRRTLRVADPTEPTGEFNLYIPYIRRK
jgi:hypothetical protein